MFSSRPVMASVSQDRMVSVSQGSLALVSLDPLDGVWLSRPSQMNTGSPYWSVNTALVSSSSFHPKVAVSRWIPPVLIWSSTVKSYIKCLMHISRSRAYRINMITKSYYETAISKLRDLNTKLYWRSYTITDALRLFRLSGFQALASPGINMF